VRLGILRRGTEDDREKKIKNRRD
jgi:hypothetical protein